MEEIAKTLVVLWAPWLTLVFGFLPIHFKHRIHIIEKELLRRAIVHHYRIWPIHANSAINPDPQ